MADVNPGLETEDSSRMIARAVWGVLLIWTGAVVLLSWGWGVGLVGAGVVLLAAQAWRSLLGLKVDGLGLTAGALFVLCGLATLFRAAIDFFPIVCIVAGVALLVSIWSTARARHAPHGPTDVHSSAHPPA